MDVKVHSNGATRSRVRLRTIALPTEHGGWGFVFEPILLGLLVAPSAGGLALAVATLAIFLIRQPLKVIMVDRRRGLQTARSHAAKRFLLFYLAVAALAMAMALRTSDLNFLRPLLLAAPFGLIFLFYDLTRPGRALTTEIAAPVVLASLAAAIPLADGWAFAPALALWAAMCARAIPSVLYVRARLRLDREKATSLIVPIVAHAIALLLVVLLAGQDLLPQMAIWAFLILLLRTVIFLAPWRPMVSVKVIGFTELGLGILLVLMIALPYQLP